MQGRKKKETITELHELKDHVNYDGDRQLNYRESNEGMRGSIRKVVVVVAVVIVVVLKVVVVVVVKMVVVVVVVS
ncbi:hypothetical protein ElyMa_000898600 [Elysia marginata]|uniref:Uncharacterized protein n=1 Tax=Elysia marginata TaxID=1093978 RepID=A0AAV4HA65_9GAST|nr:hypothetical protein ElyMa_000898600 [Elysia marginata]